MTKYVMNIGTATDFWSTQEFKTLEEAQAKKFELALRNITTNPIQKIDD